jgi:hypothetical protein
MRGYSYDNDPLRRRLTAEVVTHGVDYQEVSWARVWAVLALLLFWLPLFGLAAGALAYWLNRRSQSWIRRAGQISFVATLIVHAGLSAVFIVNTVRW